MQCVVCRNFYPPGFTNPIPDTKYHKCKFCEQGKDQIMSVSALDKGVQWDVKNVIVEQYKRYLNDLASSAKRREGLIKGTRE
jgi:hypothetical protein